MARNKNMLVKEIKSDLEQSQHILNSVESTDKLTYEEVKAAATSASQAANNLYRLAGMLDVEADLVNDNGN